MQAEFPRLAVDPVVFRYNSGRLEVLLCRRTEEPQIGMFGLPGSYSFAHSSTRDSLMNALKRKTNFDPSDLSYIEQLYFFDDDIDPRGHAVSLAYLCLTNKSYDPELCTGAGWFDFNELPELAFDHKSIVNKAISSLQNLLITTTTAKFLVGSETTLNNLHKLYEATFGKKLDNRNFRKKLLGFDVLVDTGKIEEGKPYRPSKIYRFKNKSIVNLFELKF
jgi:8-oxo-dGTP diphosphatase